MASRTIVNLLLGTVVIIIAGYLFFFTGARPQGAAYNYIDPASVNRISILQPDKPAMTFKKQNNGWWMEQPLHVHANRRRMGSILQLIRMPGNSPFAAKDSELQKLGLADQSLRLELNDHDFVFGNTDPIDNERYVKYKDTVYLIEDNLYYLLRQDPAFFADPRLVPDSYRLIQLALPNLTLVREGDRWLTIPEQAINNDDAALLAERWENAEATTVYPSAAFEPLGTVTVYLKDQDPLTFDIISLTPSLTLARKDLGLQYFMGNYQPEHLGLGSTPAPAQQP